MHALSVSLLRAKQLPVITNGLGASPHAGSTCTIGVVTVRPLNRLPARLYFKLKPDPNNTFFFIFTCTTQYPWVLANLNLSQAMAPSKKKRTHTVFRDSSAHRSASTSKPRFVGVKVRLGDVVSASSERNKGGRCSAVYSVTNSQGFVPSEDYFSKEVYSKDLKTYRVVERNMIAYNPSRINVGSVALQDKCDEVVVSPLYVVFSVDESRVKPGYAVRFLKSKPGLDQIAFQSIGTVRNNLKFKALCQMRLKLPSLAVQEERLANLVSIESQINQSRKAIEEFDQLAKSRFVEMFGDPTNNKFDFPVEKLGGLGLLERGKSKHRPRNAPELRGGPNGPYPLIQTGDIANAGTYLATYEDTYTELGLLQSRIWPKGTLCITIAANIAKTSILAIDACFPDSVVGFTTNGKVTNLFMHYWFSFFQSILEKQAPQAAQKNINLRILQNLDVIAPPLALQQEFADFVAQVDKSRFVRDHEINFR